MKTPSFPSLAVCSILFLAGCEAAPSQQDIAPRIAASPAMLVTAVPDGYHESEDPDARYEGFKARSAMRSAVRYAIGGAETWQEAHVAAERAAAEHPDAPDFEKEQYIAILMLETQLLPGSPETDPDRLDAIGDYTEVLVRHRNPTAGLIDRALSTLEAHWPTERVATTASTAYAAAERYVEIKTDCDGCGLESIRASAARVSGGDAVVRSLQSTLDGSASLRARF